MINIFLSILLIYIQYYHTHLRKLSASNNVIHYDYNMIQNINDNFTKYKVCMTYEYNYISYHIFIIFNTFASATRESFDKYFD